jgi:cobalt/nickel transport system permease protein
VALQLALSGISPANIAIPAMGGIHALIGIGEGLITMGALGFILAARPDLIRSDAARPVGGKIVSGVGLGVALLLAVISPLASAHPDGLERVAEQQGFRSAAQAPVFTFIPDYVFPGVSNQTAATILAGIMGTLLVFSVALGIAYTRRRKPTQNTEK